MGAPPPAYRSLDVCGCSGCRHARRRVTGWTVFGVIGLTVLFFAPGLIASYLIDLPL